MRVLRVALFLLVAVPTTVACTQLVVWKDVHPSIDVVVTNPSGEPLAGVTVIANLASEADDLTGSEVARTYTDETGVAHFKGLLVTRKYHIVVAPDTAFRQSRYVHVTEKSVAPIQRRLRVVWPEEKVLRLREFAGTLKTTGNENEGDGDPYAHAEMVVKNAKTSQEVARIDTDESGRFSVPQLSAGFYLVEITHYRPVPPEIPKGFFPKGIEMRGELALEIASDRDAGDSPVEIALEFSTCGLVYRARSVPTDRATSSPGGVIPSEARDLL